jgi:cytochrome c oxidase assembly protein subunit 15
MGHHVTVRVPHLSPEAYRRITLVAAILLAIIIVTGGAVRLTDSGLGCPSWPNCEAGRLTPHSASDYNAMVEFVNRLFTGLVSIAVIVAVLGSLVRTPRRRDLVWLSAGLVAGVFAQAVLGGLTVLFELKPQFVMAHFLVSIALLTNAIVLYRRAGRSDDATESRPIVSSRIVALSRVLLVVATVVLCTGTVVTGAGPHSGGGNKDDVQRLDFSIPEVARLHGTVVMVFLGLVLVTLWLVWRDHAAKSVQNRLTVLLVVLLAQAGVGYAQYFSDIPPLLVGIHIAGATAVWTATVWFALGCFEHLAPARAHPLDSAPSPSLLAST